MIDCGILYSLHQLGCNIFSKSLFSGAATLELAPELLLLQLGVHFGEDALLFLCGDGFPAMKVLRFL